MDRKTFIITVVLSLIIFGTFVVLVIPRKQSASNSFAEQQVELCLADNLDKYNYIMALKTRDKIYCENAEGKDYCIANINKDASVCNSLEDASGVNACKAYILKDSSLCNADDYNCLAFTTGNKDYCMNLEQEESWECIAAVNLDAGYYLSKEKMQECEDEGSLIMTVMTNDNSYCAKIVNPEIKQNCLA